MITYPDLSKQFRVYSQTVISPGEKKKSRYKNPFDGEWTRDIDGDVMKHFDHVQEVSMKRTKKKVYDYAKCNNWDWFVTLTFNKRKVDRYDYDECIKKLKFWIDYVRRSSPTVSYLVVPEQHKDGAWHFHGLFAGLNERQIVWTGKYVIKRDRKEGRRSRMVRTNDKIYKFGSYKLGWMTATKVRDKDRVTSYITKYITKDMMAGLYGRKRYWNSRNLLTPVEEVYNIDKVDRFILAGELEESAQYSTVSYAQYGDMTQVVEIFEVDSSIEESD